MGVISSRGLRRKSLSSVRTRQTIETIEATIGRTIGGNTSDNTSSKETSSERELGKIHKEVWQKPTNGDYFFKKAHAVSYAMACVVHMNLLCEKFKT